MTTLTSSTYVDLRCPVGPKKLLARMLSDGEHVEIVPGNLMELSCRFCRTHVLEKYGRKPDAVFHRFNIIGELVESEIKW